VPKFYFDIFDGGVERDDTGIEIETRDVPSALAQAFARELAHYESRAVRCFEITQWS